MTTPLKARFEELARTPPPGHKKDKVEVVVKVGELDTWDHSGFSGGGHSMHDGKYKHIQEDITETTVKEKTVFAQPPPNKRSLGDLP